MTSFGHRAADWVAVAGGGLFGLALAYAALLQVGTDGVPAMIALASALVMLVAVLVLWRLTRNGMLRGLAAGLAAGWTLLFSTAAIPSATPVPDADQVQSRLRQIASTTDTPIYYLGTSFNGLKLSGLAVSSGTDEALDDDTLDPGEQLTIFYGQTCSGCGAAIEIVINPDMRPADPTRDVRVCLQGTEDTGQLSEAAKSLRRVDQEAAATPPTTASRAGLC
jgi:hypothetical protein